MLSIREGVRDGPCGVIELEGEEVPVHVWFEGRGTDKVVQAESGEFVPVDELVVLVSRSCSLILQFFREVLQETAPSGGWAELGDVIGIHLDAFIGEHDETATRDVVNVVQVVGRSDGGKVLRGLESTDSTRTPWRMC